MSPAWGRDFRPLNATNRVFPYRRKDIIDPMRVTPILHVAVIAAAVLTLPTAARGASAKDVFTKVAPSVVVVLALDEGGKTMGQGSGVVVGEYEVVTNCHVLGKAADVAVRQAADWSVRETYRMAASLLARNDERDLCLLFVDELPAPPAAQAVRLGAAKALSVGEEVYAVGAPAGLELSLSRGIVSQLRGAFGKRSAPLVQTDAAISPGSSGGGLFNQVGELVGLTTFKWRGESLNFALPAEWIEELRAQGRSKLMEAKRRVECPKNPTYECVIDLALGTANSSTVVETFRSANTPTYRCDRLLDIAATQTRVEDARGAKKTLSAAFEAARESRIFKRAIWPKLLPRKPEQETNRLQSKHWLPSEGLSAMRLPIRLLYLATGHCANIPSHWRKQGILPRRSKLPIASFSIRGIVSLTAAIIFFTAAEPWATSPRRKPKPEMWRTQ